MSDVRDLAIAPHASFVQAALRRRGERLRKTPRVRLDNIDTILLSANRAFPLVTIHRERVDPHVCWIGRVLGIANGRVSILEIGADARWDTEPSEYRLSEITRVNFGNDYENALHLVGGDPPWNSLRNSQAVNYP